MIRYDLKCERGHGFDSWFSSAEAFDTLKGRHQLDCPECGSSEVSKALMAPKIAGATPPKGPGSPGAMRAAVLAAIREKVEATSTYVGKDFAREARAMHEGTMQERSIYGEARPEEARALIEDGVPIAPLPFTPRAKTN